jgi:hypothetical protein
MNPNILIRRIVRTNKLNLDIEEKTDDRQLELEVKIDKLEEVTQEDIERKNIII